VHQGWELGKWVEGYVEVREEGMVESARSKVQAQCLPAQKPLHLASMFAQSPSCRCSQQDPPGDILQGEEVESEPPVPKPGDRKVLRHTMQVVGKPHCHARLVHFGLASP